MVRLLLEARVRRARRAGLREEVSRALLGSGACVLGMLFTWTLTDHSRTGVQTWLGVPAATVHLLAMMSLARRARDAAWCACSRATCTRPLEPVVPRFSQLALGCFVASA